ncbi:Glycosyltransferase involved in cell wall bisynthesis [Mucilaginibacter gossypiicola]|uniref:Glycosyltransferase involved in cell wall bisynthesis n=1 Tax=Mucilaginibacter gossypiicola TaxID=551995 RepID=A0A1H8QRI8_9SPHI|nr:glycosyltransferase family 1 protein [Mucilaginibacter gossypiicola]SEO56617.1 Glycosyltransferase involved in cell wall bisynthesis [Mucilaginibacter gossypiicola]
MKKIKVAFFAEILIEDFDGAVRTMYQLINRIDRNVFEFLFVYGAGPDSIAGFESLKVPALTLPINTGYTMAIPALVMSELKEEIDNFSPDVIHIATPSLLGNFALKYATQQGLPVMSIYHTHFISYIDYYLKHTPFLINKVKQIMAESHKVFYNQCDQIYVPSGTMKDELIDMGVDTYRMKLWQRGIDTNLFSPGHKKSLRPITGNDSPTILFASRLVWEKNLETLFEIYAIIQDRHPKVNFIIAGDGVARKACEAKMPKAIFTGKVDHKMLSVLYASSTLFLFPSVSEAYGNVVLEAMASGLPCVIANGGGSKDFIEQGINGFKCEPYNANCYVERIELLLKSNSLREQFIEEGLQYSSRLSWECLASAYFDDLAEMAGADALNEVR